MDFKRIRLISYETSSSNSRFTIEVNVTPKSSCKFFVVYPTWKKIKWGEKYLISTQRIDFISTIRITNLNAPPTKWITVNLGKRPQSETESVVRTGKAHISKQWRNCHTSLIFWVNTANKKNSYVYYINKCTATMNFIPLSVKIHDNKEELLFTENLETKFIKEVEKLDSLQVHSLSLALRVSYLPCFTIMLISLSHLRSELTSSRVCLNL